MSDASSVIARVVKVYYAKNGTFARAEFDQEQGGKKLVVFRVKRKDWKSKKDPVEGSLVTLTDLKFKKGRLRARKARYALPGELPSTTPAARP